MAPTYIVYPQSLNSSAVLLSICSDVAASPIPLLPYIPALLDRKHPSSIPPGRRPSATAQRREMISHALSALRYLPLPSHARTPPSLAHDTTAKNKETFFCSRAGPWVQTQTTPGSSPERSKALSAHDSGPKRARPRAWALGLAASGCNFALSDEGLWQQRPETEL
jgi:hypothetical protein